MAIVEQQTVARVSSAPRLSVLLIGDVESAEFRAALAGRDAEGYSVEAFLKNEPRFEVQTAETIARALSGVASGEFVPDLIVLAQTRPGQFSADEVDRLRRATPSARLSGLLGSWCEGEARSGTPWPGVMRTYWHQ